MATEIRGGSDAQPAQIGAGFGLAASLGSGSRPPLAELGLAALENVTEGNVDGCAVHGASGVSRGISINPVGSAREQL